MKAKSLLLMLVLITAAISSFLTAPAQALDIGLDYAGNLPLQNSTETDPRNMAVDIIRYLMTFLGIIAVAIILYGGFLWMTAAGNEDKVDKGKKAIIAGAIGLIIILAAFAIVTFVVSVANDAVSGNLN